MKETKRLVTALCLAIAMAVVIPSIVPSLSGAVTVEAATKVKLNKTKATLYVGKTLQLKLKGATGKVTWSSSKKSIATVSKTGKVKAKKKGTATITAKYNGKKYKCKVTAKKKVALKSISLNKTSIIMEVNDEDKLKVKYNPTNTTASKEVNWVNSNDSVVEVYDDGSIYAYEVGTATITARVGNKKATCKVTVKKPDVEKVVLNTTSLELEKGDSTILTATVYPYNADDTITWGTSNSNVATVKNGVVTAVSEGTAVITAKAGDLEAVCNVIVMQQEIVQESTVADKLNMLKNYILTYGTENSNGSKFIKWTNEMDEGTFLYGIVYEESTNAFQFICTGDTDMSLSSTTMYLNIDINGNVSPEYILVYKDYNIYCKAQASFDVETYDGQNEVNFDVINSGGMTQANVQKLANSELRVAFAGWNILLLKEVNLQLCDIGFTSYK